MTARNDLGVEWHDQRCYVTAWTRRGKVFASGFLASAILWGGGIEIDPEDAKELIEAAIEAGLDIT